MEVKQLSPHPVSGRTGMQIKNTLAPTSKWQDNINTHLNHTELRTRDLSEGAELALLDQKGIHSCQNLNVFKMITVLLFLIRAILYISWFKWLESHYTD